MRTRTRLALFASLLAFSASSADAAAPLESWAPLGAYEQNALSESTSFRMALPTNAGAIDVAFSPNTVLAANYGAEEMSARGLRRGSRAPDVTTYAATIGSAAARDFARLSVQRGRGRVSGLMRVSGVFYDLSADLARGDYLLRVRELPAHEIARILESCGAELAAAALTSGTTSSTSAPATSAATALREIELGTEVDAPFVAQAGSVADANAHVVTMVNAMNGIYEVDLGLTNRIVVQRAWVGSDPYSSSDSGTLLGEFRTQFASNVATAYDDALLFSGRDFENGIVGRAWVSATCGGYRYGVNQWYAQSDSLTHLIAAHELGHNLGASHSTTGGLMGAVLDPNVDYFSAESQTQIAAFTANASCLALASGGAAGTAPTLTPVGPQAATEGVGFSIQLNASDADGDPISYGASPLPPGATLTANGLFEWRPARDAAACGGTSSYSIRFSATEPSGLAASENVPIDVADSPTGAAPVLADPADQNAKVVQLVQIQLQASDADGDSIAFSGASLPPGASLTANGLFAWTPSASQAGKYTVTFTATDCTGQSSSQAVAITVRASKRR